MAENKKRDTIHISYNDKKYYKDMKRIVEAWDKEGDVRSKKVCEDVIIMDKARNSMTLNKLLYTFEWIENTLLPCFTDKDDECFKQAVEQVFSGVISINGDKLSEFLSNPFAKVEEVKKSYQFAKAQQEVATTVVEKEEIVVKEETSYVSNKVSTVDETNEIKQEKTDVVEENNNSSEIISKHEDNLSTKDTNQEDTNKINIDNNEDIKNDDITNKEDNNKNDESTNKAKKFGKGIMKSFN